MANPANEIAEARAELRARLAHLLGAHEVPRLDEALTHPSFANETGCADNQRLEFLGDSVLGLVVSELLISRRPDANEGALTRMRSALVNAEALAEWARSVDLGRSIALGRGARAGSERDQTNVLADAVEALVAASYEAGGLELARVVVEEIVSASLTELSRLESRDPKSELQERVQARGMRAPTYRVKEKAGPSHEPTFEVEVLVDEVVYGTGHGRSKRLAERNAADSALLAHFPAADEPEDG